MYICILWFVGFVYSVAFSDDGAYLATGSGDSTVNLIDMKNLKLIKTFENMHTSNKIYLWYIYILEREGIFRKWITLLYKNSFKMIFLIFP